MKQLFFLVALILVIQPLSAQSICEVYEDSPYFTECQQTENGISLFFNACGGIRIDVEPEAVYFNGELVDETFDLASVLQGDCGGNFFSDRAPTGSPLDPAIQQNIQMFQSRMTSRKTKPTNSKTEPQSGEASFANLVSANIGTGSFDVNGLEGESSSANVGYAREAGGGYLYGGNVVYNQISFKSNSKDINNSSVSLFLEKAFSGENKEVTVGINGQYMFLDNNVGDNNGQGVGFYSNYFMYPTEGQKYGVGVLGQWSRRGDLETLSAGLSGSYGLKLGAWGAFNADVLYLNSRQEFNGHRLNTQDSDFITARAVLDTNLGPFVVNAGFQKVYLLDNFKSIEFILNGRLRF